jgi:alkyl hydroperoxide reductase subunit D
MPRIQPVTECKACETVGQAYTRVKEGLGLEQVPLPFQFHANVPVFLQDFQMNFRRFVWQDGKLDARTKGLLAWMLASYQKSSLWADWLQTRCLELGWTEKELTEALAVASTCGMYNVFFKFRDISGSELFSGMGVGLRAHTFSGTSLDDRTVELINITVSDINGCKPCTSGHVEKARALGLSDDAILEAVQCAATMTAGIHFLELNGCGG